MVVAVEKMSLYICVCVFGRFLTFLCGVCDKKVKGLLPSGMGSRS